MRPPTLDERTLDGFLGVWRFTCPPNLKDDHVQDSRCGLEQGTGARAFLRA